MDKNIQGNICIGCNTHAGVHCSTCRVGGSDNISVAEQERAAKMEVRRILNWALARAADDCPLCGGGGGGGYVYLNHDWLGSLTAAELVDWIKNEASEMSDAELLRWMEEKHG